MMDMMDGGMMWGMGLIWLLVVIVLVLGAAALIKCLFLRRTAGPVTGRAEMTRAFFAHARHKWDM